MDKAVTKAAELAPQHKANIVLLSICPCGALAATGHLDGTLRLRQTTTGKLLHTAALGPAWVECVSWSPDGQWLAASSGRVLHLLDGTGRLLHSQPHSHSLDRLSWQPDSRGLAVVSGAAVVHWALRGHDVPALEPGPALTSGRPVSVVAWSPAGHHLATGLPKGRLGGWQLPGGHPVAERRVVGRLAPVPDLSWHSSGQWLAAAHGPDVGVWTVENAGLGHKPQLLTGHPLPVQQVVFQPHGSLLASADAGGTLALWEAEQPAAPVSTHPLGSAATALHWMANGCCLAVGTAGGRVMVLSVSGG